MKAAYLLRLMIALTSLAVSPAAANPDPDGGQLGFIAKIVASEQIGEEFEEGWVAPFKYIKVKLRAIYTLDKGKPIEFDAVITTSFSTIPDRIFVVIDSAESKKLIYWTDVGSYVCFPPEMIEKLDIDSFHLSEMTLKGSKGPCFSI